MDLLIEIIKALGPGIIVGIVLAKWNSDQKKKDEHEKEIADERIKGESLKLALLVATAQLSYATTMALKRGSTNGEVEPAVKQYNKAMQAFRDFEREQIARSTMRD